VNAARALEFLGRVWNRSECRRRHRLVAVAATVLAAAHPALALDWDPNVGTAGAQGGVGTWTIDGAVLNWNDGVQNVAWPAAGDAAVFGGTGGAVTVDTTAGTVQATDLTFNVTGYIISGGVLTLNGPTGTNVSGASNATINSVLAGAVGLNKSGAGSLVLRGANTFTGAISITGGTLDVAVDGNLGATTNAINIDGGRLRGVATTNTAINAGRVITVGPLGATFESAGSSNFGTPNAADRITGSGPITKVGSANFRIEGANNTLSSNWTLTQGVVEVNNALGLGSGSVRVTAGNLAAAGNLANAITLAGGAVSPVNGNPVFGGPVTVEGTGLVHLNDFYQDTARQLTFAGKLSSTAATDTLTIGVSRANAALNAQALLLSNETNDFAGTIIVQNQVRLDTRATDNSGKTLGTALVRLAGGQLFLKDNADSAANSLLNYGNNVDITAPAGTGNRSTSAQQLPPPGGGPVSVIDVNAVTAGTGTNNTFVMGNLTIGAQTLRVQGANGYGLSFAGTTTINGAAFFDTTTANLTLGGVVADGGFALNKTGPAALVLADAATLAGVPSANVTGTLRLDNSGTSAIANRLNDAAAINLANGTIALVGPASGALTEHVGAVVYSGGAGLAASAPAASTDIVTLSAASLARGNARSTLTFNTRAAGTLGNTDRIIVGGAPPAQINGIVGPFAVNGTDAAYVNYGANGFGSAAFTSTDLATSTALDLVDSAGGAAPASAAAYAMRLGTTALTGGPVAISGGGLILNNGATAVVHTAPIVFGSAVDRQVGYLFGGNNDGVGAVGGTQTATLGGLVTASELVKFGPGAIRLSNTGQVNNAGLANAIITVNGGTLEVGERGGTLNNSRALPGTVSVVLNSGAVNFFEQQTLANLNTAPGTQVRLGSSHSNGTAKILTVNNAVDNVFAGSLTSDANNNDDPLFVKGGVGKFTFTGSISVGRSLTANYGEIVLTNTVAMGGGLTDRQRIEMTQGGTITLDNTVYNHNDRIGLNAGTANGTGGYFALRGGTFNYLGNATVNSTETFGTATALIAGLDPVFAPGADTINIVPGTGRAAILTSERNIVRQAGSSVLFKGTNFGGTRAAANTASFNYNTSGPTLVGGGGAAASPTLSIYAGVIVDSIVSGVDTFGLSTYQINGTGLGGNDDVGVRRLAATEHATTIASGATALNNIRLNTAVTGIDSATTINALHLAGGGSIAGTGVLNVNSGTILSANNGGAGANTITVAGLDFTTTPEAIFYTASDLSVSSVISGTAPATSGLVLNNFLTKGGAGILTLSGDNTFTGAAHINGGTLAIGSNTALGAATNALNLNNGSALRAVSTFALGDGTTNRSIVLGAAGGGSIDVGAGHTLTVGGVISGGIHASVVGGTSLTKTGDGTLTLTGASTYTGGTTVANGTLLVNGSLAAGSAVSVVGGTLGGSGSIAGPLTVSGGTLAPGASPGKLTVANAVTLAAGSTFAVELNGLVAGTEYDQLAVTGGSNGVTLDNAQLAVGLGYSPSVGDSFRIIDKQSTGAVTGTFLGLPEGGSVAVGGNVLSISYLGGTGNDVTLTVTAVPEPAAAGLLAIAATGLLAPRRRR